MDEDLIRTKLQNLESFIHAEDVRIVYVEEAMPSMYRHNENREAAVPTGAIADMMHRWEVPTRIEADQVEWWVNEKPIQEGVLEHH